MLYAAPECSLCERARAVLDELRDELGFELEEVDISGDDELEARYRVYIPVVEVDGERAFVYEVDSSALRSRLSDRSHKLDVRAGE